MKTRTDFPTALEMVLDVLKTGEPYSVSKLAQEANLNFRTVKKILHVLESSQSSFSGKHLDVSNLDNLTVVKMKEKTGMTMFPEHIQNLIIKTSHYPTVSREEEVLTYLFLKNAINPDFRIDLPEDHVLKELVEAEHVGKINGKYYLTEDGRYIAKGALKLYPELKETVLKPSKEERRVKNEFIQWQSLQPPSIPLMKQMTKEIVITT
ncbi:MAG: hypothetical protein IH841_08560 [Thaumarchaeota archaeon]|nr:hypothetical protein [Nitrososphaerota archaeon]